MGVGNAGAVDCQSWWGRRTGRRKRRDGGEGEYDGEVGGDSVEGNVDYAEGLVKRDVEEEVLFVKRCR
jgi:hypothetical protein